MKKTIFLTAALLLISCSAFSHQTFAKTTNGRNVVLESNGTWRYTDNKVYSKSCSANTFVKSKKNSLGVWFDEKKWQNNKIQLTEDSEFTFSLKDDTGYATMINERIGMPHEFIRSALLGKLEDFLDDLEVSCEESRVINDLPVTYYEVHGKAKGLSICYMFYVYSNENETTQLVAYTCGKKIDYLKTELEEFINGLAKK